MHGMRTRIYLLTKILTLQREFSEHFGFVQTINLTKKTANWYLQFVKFSKSSQKIQIVTKEMYVFGKKMHTFLDKNKCHAAGKPSLAALWTDEFCIRCTARSCKSIRGKNPSWERSMQLKNAVHFFDFRFEAGRRANFLFTTKASNMNSGLKERLQHLFV